MGGNLNELIPFSTDTEPIQTHEVGKYTLHVVKHPNKELYYIAEGETGAFVGFAETPYLALALVVMDLHAGDQGIVEDQMEYARKTAPTSNHVTPKNSGVTYDKL
jgi:hypothetical protein